MSGSGREPIFNVPGSVVFVLAVLVGFHIFRAILSETQDVRFVLAMALIPARYTGMAGSLPGGEIAGLTSFLTHMLVHGSAAHLLINAAWLLAFGGAVALRTGGARFLLVCLVTGLAAAGLFLAVNPGLEAPMVGASGAVSGLMGATLRFLFSALDRGGLWRLREAPWSVPVMPLAIALTDKRIITVTAVWLALNLLAAFGLGGPDAGGGIAWEAHVGGYLVGFLTFGLFDPKRPNPFLDRPRRLH